MHLDDALAKAAARGMSLTVTEFTFQAPDGYEESDQDDAYAAAAAPAGSVQTAVAAHGAVALAQVKAQLTESEKRAHTLAAQVADLEKKLADIAAAGSSEQPMQSDALARIAELEAQLAAGGASSNGNGSEVGATLAAFESYPQSVLALGEKAQKGIDRIGAKTVGEVKEALLGGKLGNAGKGSGRLGRLEVIEVANKLLGQVPSAVGAALAPAQGGGGEGGMSGVPAGLQIKSWDELLGSARKKELSANAERDKKAKASAAIQQLRASQLTPDTQQQLQTWEALQTNADKMMGIFDAQVSQFLYTLGLPYIRKEVRTVNGSLEKAGLHHLINEAPAPQGVPAA